MTINDFSVFFFDKVFFYISVFIPPNASIIPIDWLPIMGQPFHRLAASFYPVPCFWFNSYRISFIGNEVQIMKRKIMPI